MSYQIRFSGLASTPDSIIVVNKRTGNKVEKIELADGFITGKQQRELFHKHRKRLEQKYNIN